MATGRRVVAPGQQIASDWGNKAWDQTVQCFASAADRDTQFPTASLHPGAITYQEDSKQVTIWNGSAWRAAAADITTSGSQMIGVGYNPALHRPHTFLWHTSVTTNQYGQIAVPLSVAAFAGYMGVHVTANNRPWFALVDFSNAPTLSSLLLVMRDTVGPVANQSVDINATVPGWK
jgi:hypothetical protein